MKIQYEDLLASPYFEKLIDSIIVFAVLLAAYIILSKIIKQKATSLNEQYNWQKVSGYIIVCCGIFFIGRIWIHAIQPMFTFFGIIAAALTISQKEAIIFRHFSPKVYMTVQMNRPAGIRLTARFICEVRATRDTEMNIWQDLLEEFDRHEDISISYDTA